MNHNHFEYVDLPACAAPVAIASTSTAATAAPVPLPRPPSYSAPPPLSPSAAKPTFNLASLLLSASVNIPAPPAAPRLKTNGSDTAPLLLSSGTPLAIQTTTVNFTRFVSRSGPVFWVQDRVEEIVMWRKGNVYTAAWMAGYAFLCYYPRLVLLIPHASLIAVLLQTYSTKKPDVPPPPPTSYLQSYAEGSAGWYANLQAIQNLMGAVSDAYDAALPAVPLLTYASPYTAPLLLLLVLSLAAALPVLPLVPLPATFLVLGLAPFVATHPVVQAMLPALAASQTPLLARLRMMVQRGADNDRLAPEVWNAPLETVELYENERWDAQYGVWGKVMRPGERKTWTRGRDGWSGGLEGDGQGTLSHLTFALEPGWSFVETESWRADFAGTWVECGADGEGFVYTNDAWQDPHPEPLEDWKQKGAMTRRRRWTRRIFFAHKLGTATA